jgi:hypothetical protein
MKYKVQEIDTIVDLDDVEYADSLSAKQMKMYKNQQKANADKKKREIRSKRKQKESQKVSAFYIDKE